MRDAGRDVSLDVVRLVGVVAIVAGHTWPTGWVRDATFPWHVPVFFVLTGWLWRGRPWRAELAARTSSLLRPYLFWLVLTTAMVVALRAGRQGLAGAAGEQLPDALWGGQRLIEPFTAYWFVTCLFASCLVYAAADRAGPRWRAGVVALAAVLTVVGSGPLALLPLSVGTALPAVVFLEAGRQLRRLEPVLDRPPAVAAAAVVAALTAAAVASGVMPDPDLKIGDFGVPVLGVVVAVVLSAALVVLARRACRGLGEGVGRAVAIAATALVPVVLLHPLAREVPALDAREAADFATGLLAPLLLALGLARTRWSGWALGR